MSENNYISIKGARVNNLKNIDVDLSLIHIYFDKKIRKLFIGTFLRGIMVYDMNTKSVIRPDYNLKDISSTRFKPCLLYTSRCV